MTWFLKVPKILHVYWGGGNLPYIRMLTVKSFIHCNPDWKVMLWLPQVKSVKRTWDSRELNYPVLCTDCTPELMGLPLESHEVDFKQFGFENTISEVHKSDFIRLFLLANTGGLWSDMDIIYFKPMTSLAVNIPQNADKETFVCISDYGHSAGFLMSAPPNKYYELLVKMAKNNFDPKKYQGIGATMFNEQLPALEAINKISPAVNIDMDAVYTHNAMHIKDILDGTPARFTDKSIGIHWYAGHPLWGDFIKNTNGGKGDLPNCIISDILKSINY
jgi:hypothetical protein